MDTKGIKVADSGYTPKPTKRKIRETLYVILGNLICIALFYIIPHAKDGVSIDELIICYIPLSLMWFVAIWRN